MSNEQEPLPPQQEEVRRLLAGARHTGPTPPEVVARLDSVLDELARDSDQTAPVVDLARRRRRVASLLVAAAAVVVIGIGLGQVLTSQGESESALSSDAGEDSARSGAGQSEAESQPKGQTAGEAAGPDQDRAPLAKARRLLKLRRDALADDVTVARRDRTRGYSGRASAADRAAGVLCAAHAWGSGRFVPVSYAGTPAVLVLRRPVGDTQVAEVFLCGGEEPVRSVTLPAP